MSDDLVFTIDKFTFRTATDCYYTGEGLWAKLENQHVRVGISDYLQQRSGDVAFAEVKPIGTTVAVGEELAVIETIKVNISLVSPVAGKVIQVNPRMENAPEIINADPYGAGWLAVIEVMEGENCLEDLLDPQTYFAQIKLEAGQEVKRE